METYRKYPRTPHLPWSQGATADDKRLSSACHFEGCEVVVTEKMDGENTSIYWNGHSHARSLDSKRHESRSHIRQLADMLRPSIPQGFRICGENLYAKHSIAYSSLPAYFLVFGMTFQDRFLSWDDTAEYAQLLGLQTVPVIYRGMWNEQLIKACLPAKSSCGMEIEGYVVRKAESFPVSEFGINVAKFVRANHVQTSEHWMHAQVTKNQTR